MNSYTRAAYPLSLLLLPGAVGAAEAPSYSAPLYLLKTGHIAVEARVNGRGPYRLVLDTGAPITFVSGRVAQDAGLITPERAKMPTLMGMRGQAVLKALNVGGAVARDLNVFILDHPVVEMIGQVDGPLDGIIGFSFFARFRTTLDYAAHRVTFAPSDYRPQDVTQSLVTRLTATEPRRTVLAPSGLWGMAVGAGEGLPGVVVKQVLPRSAADSAGFKPGDRLLTVDGCWIESVNDFYEAAARARPGDIVLVRIGREATEKEVKVRPRVGL